MNGPRQTGCLSTTAVDNAWHIHTLIIDGASTAIRIDGVVEATGNVGTDGQTNIKFGWNGGYAASLNGAIREIVIYDALLTGGQITDVEAYLDAHWNGGAPSAPTIPKQPARRTYHLQGR